MIQGEIIADKYIDQMEEHDSLMVERKNLLNESSEIKSGKTNAERRLAATKRFLGDAKVKLKESSTSLLCAAT